MHGKEVVSESGSIGLGRYYGRTEREGERERLYDLRDVRILELQESSVSE